MSKSVKRMVLLRSALMKSALMASLMGLAFTGCGTDPGKDVNKIEFVSTGKSTLAVGETSPLWSVSKTSVDANGRSVTVNPYTNFTLTSSDTNVSSVVNTQQLLGKATGTTLVTATERWQSR